MTKRIELSGPTAIGGVGGSGTRAVTQILVNLGFYVGRDLNVSYDNLWFTLLLRRPRWFTQVQNGGESEIFRALSIFEKAMTGSLDPRRDEFRFIVRAAIDMMFYRYGLWAAMRVKNILQSKKFDPSRYIGWGWKEPNTHIYLEYLHRYFDNLKYIHVMRHGLDMAYSSNQAQLFNWGHLFDIRIPNSRKLMPKASLDYWIKSNERAIALGERLLGEKFLMINFDELCLSPRREIEKILRFLKLGHPGVDMDNLCRLVKPPSSIGRHKRQDLSIFGQEEINALRNLGFSVDHEARRGAR